MATHETTTEQIECAHHLALDMFTALRAADLSVAAQVTAIAALIARHRIAETLDDEQFWDFLRKLADAEQRMLATLHG